MTTMTRPRTITIPASEVRVGNTLVFHYVSGTVERIVERIVERDENCIIPNGFTFVYEVGGAMTFPPDEQMTVIAEDFDF